MSEPYEDIAAHREDVFQKRNLKGRHPGNPFLTVIPVNDTYSVVLLLQEGFQGNKEAWDWIDKIWPLKGLQTEEQRLLEEYP